MVEITLPSGVKVSVSSVAEAKELLNGDMSGHAEARATSALHEVARLHREEITPLKEALASQRPNGRPGALVSDPEMNAKVWALRNSGASYKKIQSELHISSASVFRILANGGKTPAPKGAALAPKPVTSLVAPVVGRGRPENLIYEAAAAVVKAGKPVTIKQLRRLGGLTKGTDTAIGARLSKATEEGLIQRTRAGHYAPPDYQKKDWEFTAMTKEQAIETGLPLVKFMTEHPEITLRSALRTAAMKAGISSTEAAAETRLWAARVTDMVEGSGYDRAGSPPLKVTDFGLEKAAKGDSDA